MNTPAMKGMRRTVRRNGFTLIEVMIASGLIGFELLAVLTMFTVAAKSNAFSHRLTAATSLAQTSLETAKNTAYANLPLMGAAAECYDTNLNSIACTDARSIYRRETTVNPDMPVTGMSRIQATVVWKKDRTADWTDWVAGNPTTRQEKYRSTTLVSSISSF